MNPFHNIVSFFDQKFGYNTSEKAQLLHIKKNKEACKKCHQCKKKLKPMNEFICKCNNLFCPAHRFPDQHSCHFDHKADWKNKLKENNPSILPSKIEKI